MPNNTPDIRRIADLNSCLFICCTTQVYTPASSSFALGTLSTLFVISGKCVIVTLVLLGRLPLLFNHVMFNFPYPLAEHVKIALNGAAAYATLGWMTIFGSLTT